MWQTHYLWLSGKTPWASFGFSGPSPQTAKHTGENIPARGSGRYESKEN